MNGEIMVLQDQTINKWMHLWEGLEPGTAHHGTRNFHGQWVYSKGSLAHSHQRGQRSSSVQVESERVLLHVGLPEPPYWAIPLPHLTSTAVKSLANLCLTTWRSWWALVSVDHILKKAKRLYLVPQCFRKIHESIKMQWQWSVLVVKRNL